MSFELVAAQATNYPKAMMCRALGLSRSGHHAFTTRGPSTREVEDKRLDVEVAALFAEFKGRYGAPRIERELRRRGTCTSRKRVAASMKRQELAARQRRRWIRTTDSDHAEPIAPNLLLRDFWAPGPDRVWVADTTYLPVPGGFIYLVVVIDLFSRKVVGWAVGGHHDGELAAEALRRAIAKRRPEEGLIFHSDRGSEFACAKIRSLLEDAGARQSMSRTGDCWDNAVAESFFSTMEFEMKLGAGIRLAVEAEPELFTFIEGYYNTTRMHSWNDQRSPNEAEAAWRLQ